MSPTDPPQPPHRRRPAVSRRDFLRVGGMGVVGLSVAQQAALAKLRNASGRRSCILLLMNGGASPFETFDPKPEAPVEIRGPFRAVATSVPGTAVSELLPELAQRADRFALCRSVFHAAAPIHETGLQLLQAGRLAARSSRPPAWGSTARFLLGEADGLPGYVVLPRLVANTGAPAYHGQTAGFLGAEFDPVTLEEDDESSAPSDRDAADASEAAAPSPSDDLSAALERRRELRAFLEAVERAEPDPLKRAYGEHHFGRLCRQARQLVEAGVRCVTVNLCDDLAQGATFDCHGRDVPGSGGSLYTYRDSLCPMFDRALSTLLDDLAQRGLLDETLVMAIGEFGRTPHVNPWTGRDHWPGCWSALVAGGGVRGGQVIGRSDATGHEPVERPIALPELTATLFRVLEIPCETPLRPEPETPVETCPAAAVGELFG